MTEAKAFILYVWDNEESRVVAVYRAVGPGEGSGGVSRICSPRLERFGPLKRLIGRLNARLALTRPHAVFDIAKIGPFVEQMRVHYPEPRYAIRDWLASSLEDFFGSRYEWTAEEFARHKPPEIVDPFKRPERSIKAVMLCDYRLWRPSGEETATFQRTEKPGLAFGARERGGFKIIVCSLLFGARNMLYGLIRANPPECFSTIILPPDDKEMAALIASHGRYPVTFGDAKTTGRGFSCEMDVKGEGMRIIAIMTHRTLCDAVFPPELVSSDFGVEKRGHMPEKWAKSSELSRARAFLLYVWDNEALRVVELFRGVGPGKGPGVDIRMEGALPPVFDIAKIRVFTDRLKLRYPAPRYAIRDWLGTSLSDFFWTRYLWTAAEFTRHRPPDLADPFSMEMPSAKPIKLCDYSRWMPSGFERHSHMVGSKPGLPHDEARFHAGAPAYLRDRHAELELEMRERGLDPGNEREKSAYMADLKRRGLRTYETAADMPRVVSIFSTALRMQARALLFEILELEKCPVEKIVVPQHEKEVRALLLQKHSCPVEFNRIDQERRFHYHTRNDDGSGIVVMAGTHWNNCSGVFFADVLNPDIG